MRRGAAGLIGLYLLAGVTAPGHPDSGWSGSIVGTTDYVFRGLSQTQNRAVVQADLHYLGAGGWFAGAWTSKVGFEGTDEPSREVNLYAGIARALTPDWTGRLTVVHYEYLHDRGDYDYDELSVGADYQNRLFLTVAWSPDTSRYSYVGAAHHRSAISYEINVRQPLRYGLSATAGVGYYDLKDLFGRTYWSGSAGILYGRGPWQLDVTYYEASDEARRLFGRRAAANQWVATLLWRF